MATFKAVVRRPRADGFYSVYIRVTHRRQTLFIKTDKMITKRELSRSSEIADAYLLQFCSQKILGYQERLNRHDISDWTGAKVMPFSVYARKYIDRFIDNGQERSAKNYQLALQHMERFFGTTQVRFSQLTSVNVQMWIETLNGNARDVSCMHGKGAAISLSRTNFGNQSDLRKSSWMP